MNVGKYLKEEKKKLSIDDVAHIVNNEGIGYAVTKYMSYKDIEDKELAKAWKEAKKWLDKIENIIEPYMY